MEQAVTYAAMDADWDLLKKITLQLVARLAAQLKVWESNSIRSVDFTVWIPPHNYRSNAFRLKMISEWYQNSTFDGVRHRLSIRRGERSLEYEQGHIVEHPHCETAGQCAR